MKTKKLLREIKGVFEPPKKEYYLGKLRYGIPYFYPKNHNSTIISFRILKRRPLEEYNKIIEKFPWRKKEELYSNLPMVRKNRDWIIKIFNKEILVSIGFPIVVKNIELGWKEKYGVPRFEWSPMFQLYFFKWQFCILYNAPERHTSLYYEMILWWMYFNDKDLAEAERTWDWSDSNTKKSTWNKEFLV